ncbi:hypothetical protein DDE05_25295, partial [Streptomyces cavourensis]
MQQDFQPRQARLQRTADVHVQAAPAAARQFRAVALRLGGQQGRQVRHPRRRRRLAGRIRGNEQKVSAVRAAFVQLAAGMEIARSEAAQRGVPSGLVQHLPQTGQVGVMRCVAGDIGQHGHIGARRQG